MFHFMTTKTRNQMQGKAAGEPDMSDKRGLAKRKRDRANNTKPAVSRPGQAYPGGRSLRRSLKNLSLRQNNFVDSVKGHQQTKPGSMKS